MALTIFARGSYTKRDQVEQESLLIPVQLWKMKRKISNSSYVSDRIAMKKTLMLCTGCEEKMGRRWPKSHHYCEITMFHSVGHCDGCRAETSCALFVWEGSKWWQGIQDMPRVNEQKLKDWQNNHMR